MEKLSLIYKKKNAISGGSKFYKYPPLKYVQFERFPPKIIHIFVVCM